MTENNVLCSYCGTKGCFENDFSKAPAYCPSVKQPELLKEAREKLEAPENQKWARSVARTWKDYGKLTRIEETVRFAKLRGFQKLGLAFCSGLSPEAKLLTNILINEGFDVSSVCCLCGGLSSDDIELPEEDKILPDRQAMCNPIGQAAVLDGQNCELILLLGLCVGDDALFMKHAKAPVTVVAVKDRVTGHNPLVPLYTHEWVFTRLKTDKPKKSGKKSEPSLRDTLAEQLGGD